MTIREWLHGLQEQVLEIAKTSLREGDSEAYHVLTEFAERLQNLAPGEKPGPELIEIFSPNGQHRAQFDPARIAGQRGKCVLANGQWYTASGIAAKLVGHTVNGWVFFWQYRNDKGETRPIDDFRKSPKP